VDEPLAQAVREILGDGVTLQIAKRSELRYPQALGRPQLCLAGKNGGCRKLRTPPQHQPVVHPSGVSDPFIQENVNTFSGQ
jgi:hypothetical protein